MYQSGSILSNMAENNSQFKLRLPKELKEAIVELAEEGNRSINAEIVYRLKKGISDEESQKHITKGQLEIDTFSYYEEEKDSGTDAYMDEIIKELEQISNKIKKHKESS